jgi:hypothetical protein
MASLPDWQPLEGAASLAPGGPQDGRIVALVATEAAMAKGWAPSAALDLGRAWSAAGRRVVLVDAVLNRPTLHHAVGVPNREGLADAVLHGASMERVSHPVDGGSLFVVTAGTPVADAGSVVRSPRWYRITSGMADAGVTLVMLLGDGESGTAAFLGSASDIMVLADAEDEAPGSIRDLEPLVRAVVGPGGGSSKPSAVPASRVSKKGEGGAPRALLLVVGAIVVAAVLGFLLMSVLG